MGGSGSGSGGGGIWIDNDRCGSEFTFLVTISTEDVKLVWDRCEVGNRVVIQSTNDTIPKLLIVRERDGFIIGVVPPSASGLLNCIKSGWKYRGKIIDKAGNEYNPQIKVAVKGEK